MVDVQGVEVQLPNGGGSAFLFTDPQIHTIDGAEFGGGNQSRLGFKNFLATHKCNAVCHALGLTPVNGAMIDNWQSSGTGCKPILEL